MAKAARGKEDIECGTQAGPEGGRECISQTSSH